MSIAFVPLDCINSGLAYLESIKPSNHAKQVEIDDLLEYFNNTWIHGRFPPDLWNCYHKFSVRTTNHIEGWHRKFNEKVKRKHPNIYLLLEHLKDEEKATRTRIKLIENGHRIAQPARKYRDINRKIIQFTQEFESHQRPLYMLIDGLSNCLFTPQTFVGHDED